MKYSANQRRISSFVAGRAGSEYPAAEGAGRREPGSGGELPNTHHQHGVHGGKEYFSPMIFF